MILTVLNGSLQLWRILMIDSKIPTKTNRSFTMHTWEVGIEKLMSCQSDRRSISVAKTRSTNANECCRFQENVYVKQCLIACTMAKNGRDRAVKHEHQRRRRIKTHKFECSPNVFAHCASVCCFVCFFVFGFLLSRCCWCIVR